MNLSSLRVSEEYLASLVKALSEPADAPWRRDFFTTNRFPFPLPEPETNNEKEKK